MKMRNQDGTDTFSAKKKEQEKKRKRREDEARRSQIFVWQQGETWDRVARGKQGTGNEMRARSVSRRLNDR